MEQRSESPDPAVLSAGTDPTHIPGLGTVVTGEPDRADPDRADPEPADPEGPELPFEAADGEQEEDGAVAAEAFEADADGSGTDTDEDEADSEETPEGPAFEVSDRRGAIVANGNGVVLRLDDTEARFRWSEIGSVEMGGSRFGRRFEVAVCTADRRFDAEVEASSRKQTQEWTEDLDAVLDTWFEEAK